MWGKMAAEIPWSMPTRQDQGRITERRHIAKIGGRVTPNSGAGGIKADGRTETEVIEMKDANKTYTLKASDLDTLRRYANKEGKDASFIIQFNDPRVRAVIHIETDY